MLSHWRRWRKRSARLCFLVREIVQGTLTSPEESAALREIVILIELAVLAQPKEQPPVVGDQSGESALRQLKHPEVLAWSQRINTTSKKLSSWNLEVLEELCQLYETMYRRDGEPSSVAQGLTA